jgi:DNA primase
VNLIPPEVIDQVIAANDIVEVIGGYFPLKRAGAVYKAICPFHQERTPSFTVNPQRQIFKCFGCGAGGSVVRFVMNYENLEFVGAVKKLAERAGIRIEQNELSAEDSARYSMQRRLLALHAEATNFFHWQLMKKPSAQIARDYLKGRGIGSEIAKAWHIGYAPDEWDTMREFARSNGFTDEELIASGLVSVPEEKHADHQPSHPDERPPINYYDRFRGRVMFPICKDTDEVIAFSGRVLQADAKAAKYVNSPETILFTKGSVLFGLNKSKRALINAKSAIVCEGQLDLISAFEHGVQNVVASQGTAFTPRQANVLRRFVDEVVLCFDADAAGEKATEKSVASLLAEKLLVRVAEMPAGEDPDSMIRGQGAGAFTAQVTGAKDFFDFQIERESRRAEFSTTRGRVQTIRKLASFITLIKDPVTKEAVTSRVAARLSLSLDEFRTILNSAKPPESRDAVEVAPVSKALELSHDGAMLCLYALRDEGSRNWLLARDWKRLLQGSDELDLLRKILEADINPENPNTFAQLSASLSSAEESAISSLLRQRSIPPPENVPQCWLRFELEELKRTENRVRSQLQGGVEFDDMQRLGLELNSTLRRIAEARLSEPGLLGEEQNALRVEVRNRLETEIKACEAYLRPDNLTDEETAKMQKEILDLQKRLSDIPPPLSPSL